MLAGLGRWFGSVRVDVVVDDVAGNDQAQIGHPQAGGVRRVRVAGVDDLEAVPLDFEVVAIEDLGVRRFRNLAGKERLPEPLSELRCVVDRRIFNRLLGTDGEGVGKPFTELSDPEEMIAVAVCDVDVCEVLVE